MQRYEEMEITFRLNFNCAMNKHCDRLKKKKKAKRKQAYHCLLIAYSIDKRGMVNTEETAQCNLLVLSRMCGSFIFHVDMIDVDWIH